MFKLSSLVFKVHRCNRLGLVDFGGGYDQLLSKELIGFRKYVKSAFVSKDNFDSAF